MSTHDDTFEQFLRKKLDKANAEIAQLKALLKPSKWTKEKPTEEKKWHWYRKRPGDTEIIVCIRSIGGILVADGLPFVGTLPVAKLTGEWSDRPVQMPEEKR